MTWNYRVMRRIFNEPWDGPTPVYGIVEAYYDVGGGPGLGAWTKEFADPFGDTPEELRECLTHMLEALDKPILDEAECEAALEAGAKQGPTE